MSRTPRNTLAVAEPPQLASTKRLEDLEKTFAKFVGAVDSMMEEQVQTKAEPSEEKQKELANMIGEQLTAPEVIDELAALIAQKEMTEEMLRKSIQRAEMRARGIGAFVKSIKSSVALFMREKGIAVIEGFASAFKMYKKAAYLVIESEPLIPENYFDLTLSFTFHQGLDETPEQVESKIMQLKGFAKLHGIVVVETIRQINKDRIIATIEGKMEVPGAKLVTDDKRLQIV